MTHGSIIEDGDSDDHDCDGGFDDQVAFINLVS